MRTYFVGSHATGKTTLARWVNKHYGLPMISEVARGVLAEMEISFTALRKDHDLVAEYQKKVFAHQMAVEANFGRKPFVSDRAFDNLAYAAEHTDSLPDILNPFAEPTVEFEQYVEGLKQSVVFFCRPHRVFMAEDGVREPSNWNAIVRIDGMVKLLLKLWRIPYISLHSEDMDERVQTVRWVMDRNKAPIAAGPTAVTKAVIQTLADSGDLARCPACDSPAHPRWIGKPCTRCSRRGEVAGVIIWKE